MGSAGDLRDGAVRRERRAQVIAACSLAAVGLGLAAFVWGEIADHQVARTAGVIFAAVSLTIVALVEQRHRHLLAEQRTELTSRARALEVLAQAATDLSVLEPDRVLAEIRRCAEDIGFTMADICVLDPEGRTWTAIDGRNNLGPSPLSVQDGTAGAVFRSGDVVQIDDYRNFPGALPVIIDKGIRSTVGVPIWADGRLLGALVAMRTGDEQTQPFEIECLRLLARQAGTALLLAARSEERGRQQRRLAYQAYHDSLTGLANRAYFLERVQDPRLRVGTTALLFVDLDGFKACNDALGTTAGDKLLVAIADRMRETVRPGDVVVRYGGDEFAILLHRIFKASDAQRVAERLLTTIERPIALEGLQISVSASIGVAIGEDGITGEFMLRCADAAMYQAKARGRARVETWDATMARPTASTS